MKSQYLSRYTASIFFAGSVALSGCGQPQAEESNRTSELFYNAQYTLNEDARLYFPDKSWLSPIFVQSNPPNGQPTFTNLQATVEYFTKQSLTRDGITDAVVAYNESTNTVSISSNDSRISQYATMHKQFFDRDHAGQGLQGVQFCMNTRWWDPFNHVKFTGGPTLIPPTVNPPAPCWNPVPIPLVNGPPPIPLWQYWSFTLPMGLPLINQFGVALLDFPVPEFYTGANYLGDAATQRYLRVLERVINPITGAPDPSYPSVRFATIVDGKPIAGADDNQSPYLPNGLFYFNNPQVPGRQYQEAMVRLLTNPPQQQSNPTYRLPILALGGPARESLAALLNLGTPPGVLAHGQGTLSNDSKIIQWSAGNHPVVAPYQCCLKDPASYCQAGGQFANNQLYQTEQQDFVAYCMYVLMATSQGIPPDTAYGKCKAYWGVPVEDQNHFNRHQLCVQSKLDYNSAGSPGMQCPSEAAANAWCSNYGDNPCPDPWPAGGPPPCN